MSENEYFELMNRAKNNPLCGGVIVSKKRQSGLDYTYKEYVATLLKNGEDVTISTIAPTEAYISNYLEILRNRHGVDCDYEEVYQSSIHVRIFEKPKLLGWNIKLKSTL
jgi:hypothetical protein